MAKKGAGGRQRQTRIPGSEDAKTTELRELWETAKSDYQEQLDTKKVADESRKKLTDRMIELKVPIFKGEAGSKTYTIKIPDAPEQKAQWAADKEK